MIISHHPALSAGMTLGFVSLTAYILTRRSFSGWAVSRPTVGMSASSSSPRFSPMVPLGSRLLYPRGGRSFSGTPSDLAPLGDNHTADAICMGGRFRRRKEARR
eukprot:g15890.t1